MSEQAPPGYLQPNGRVTTDYLLRLVKLSVTDGAVMPAYGIAALAKEVVERRAAECRPPGGEERIHLVGRGVTIRHLQRQLCAWCGFVLLDEDNDRTYCHDGAQAMFWPEGRLISVTSYGLSMLAWPEDGAFPTNACCAPPAPVVAPGLRLVR